MSLQSFLNQPVAREGSKPETYDRVESFFPSAAQLRDFEGTYYSEELEVRYSIAVDGTS